MVRNTKSIEDETNGIKIKETFVLRDVYNTDLLLTINKKLDIIYDKLIEDNKDNINKD